MPLYRVTWEYRGRVEFLVEAPNQQAAEREGNQHGQVALREVDELTKLVSCFEAESVEACDRCYGEGFVILEEANGFKVPAGYALVEKCPDCWPFDDDWLAAEAYSYGDCVGVLCEYDPERSVPKSGTWMHPDHRREKKIYGG